MPFSIADVVNDPDFAQSFVITRKENGGWYLGRWQDTAVSVPMWGSIQPANPEELEQIPEADRVTGILTIHSTQPIYETNVTPMFTGRSDIVNWNNQQYRVLKVYPWSDYGFFKAIAVRMSGE